MKGCGPSPVPSVVSDDSLRLAFQKHLGQSYHMHTKECTGKPPKNLHQTIGIWAFTLKKNVFVNTGEDKGQMQKTDTGCVILVFSFGASGPSRPGMHVNRNCISSGRFRQPKHYSDQWDHNPGPAGEQIQTSCVCLGIQLSTKVSSITADGGMACHHGGQVIHDAYGPGQ